MKIYSSTNTNDKKDKNKLTTLIVGSVLILTALIITIVSIAGGNRTVQPGPDSIPANKDESVEQYVMPLSEYTLGQEYSDKLVYSATLKQWRTHNGVDFAAAKGSVVMAVFGGTVKSVEETTLEGSVVTIEQNDGIIAIYKSLSGVTVEAGDTVNAGDTIGTVDVTMITESAEGAHLHLEMKKNGEYVDPLEYLPESGEK